MSVKKEEHIGGFRVLEMLPGGSGSQGAVYRAICETPPFPTVRVGEIVALKTMVASDSDMSSFAKLKSRTDALVALQSPNVVHYRGCFFVADPLNSVHVVVMDCLEGETLKDRLAVNPDGLDVDEVRAIIDGALTGLEDAAKVGIIHRDVKPSNIFICRDGTPKLIDFEVAHRVDTSISSQAGRFIGTFDYMALEFSDPEFRGDECSDVFSLGVVLHQALSGKTPYEKQSTEGASADFAFLSRCQRAKDGGSPICLSSRATGLLSGIEAVLNRALSPDRTRRYPNFAAFHEALWSVRFLELRNGVNSYRLLRLVGVGGFGKVYKGRHRTTGQLVAIKQLLKAEYGDRFRREARIMQQFRDPCFTQFLDYFEVERTHSSYLVMAYLPNMPGASLRETIRRHRGKPLPRQEVLLAFARYAHGLAMLHRETVYHRDIKPANLYYPEGNPEGAVIMDMGIARDASGTRTTGGVPGTLDYMPPEVVLSNGCRGDAGMDIYALGLCLYEALTGKTGYPRLPTGSEAFSAFYARARAKRPPVFDDPVVTHDSAVLDLLRRMTEPERERRLDDASEVERILRALANGCVPEPPKYGTVKPSSRPSRDPSLRSSRKSGPRPVHESVRRHASQPFESQRLQEPRTRLVSISKIAAGIVILLVGGYFIWPSIERGWYWMRNKYHAIELQREKMRAEQMALERLHKEAFTNEAARAYVTITNRRAIAKRQQDETNRILRARQMARQSVVTEMSTNQVVDVHVIAQEVDALKREEETKRQQKAESEAAEAKKQCKELEVKLQKECQGLFESIWLTTSANVKNWRDETVGRAVTKIKQTSSQIEKKGGRLSADLQRELEAAIAGRKRWSVGVVDNQTSVSLTLDALGLEIAPNSSQTVVFTNGVPEGTCLMVSGFEPIPLTKERLDEKVLVVRPIQLKPLRKEPKSQVPRTFEVTPSVVAPSTRSNVVGETDVQRLAREERERQARAARIEAACKTNLAVEPIETRRDRLEKVHADLTHWQTPSTLGATRTDELKKKYQIEFVRVVGRISNKMPTVAKVDVAGTEIRVEAGTDRLIDVKSGFPLNGVGIVVHGYKEIRLTSVAEFDGKTIVLDEGRMRALPVLVSCPNLEAGVICRIEGTTVEAKGLELRPGVYKGIYSRSGFEDQAFTVRVTAGVPLTLPQPGAWVKAGVMGGLFSTVRDLSDSTTRGVKRAADEVGNIRRKSDENP